MFVRIQVYDGTTKDFSMNGNTLLPTECMLHTILNGEWTMTLKHPLDPEGRWKEIKEEAIIATPTFLKDAAGKYKKQLFRIDNINKGNTGIEATAYPIFFDAAKDVFLLDSRPTGKTGKEALDIIFAGTKYTGSSDISTATTAYYIRRNGLEAINGEDENSFLNRWGGEVIYDNYTIIVNERAGGDYGLNIIYGKNLEGMTYKVNMADVITRIVPVAYNGYMLEGTTPWVDSPNIGKYATVYTREVKFEDVKLAEDAQGDEEGFETLEDLRKELVKRCKEMFSEGCDTPTVTIDIEMVDLSKTEEYKDYAVLEEVGLGDTVHCQNAKLNVTTNARIVEMEWDCIKGQTNSLTIGEVEYSYFGEVDTAVDSVSQVIRPDNTLMAEKIKGIMNAIDTQLRCQKSIAQKQDVRAILFEDTDPDSPTYGAMCLGTQGFQIADHLTADGRDWDWSTAFTAKGGIADVIITGILSDKKGWNYWNLDTGEFALASTATVGGETVEKIADDAAEEKTGELDKKLNQTEVFNRLTNNGTVQGIFMKDGQLYINAAYIVAGILRDAAGLNYWNLKTGEMKVEGRVTAKEFVSTDGNFFVVTTGPKENNILSFGYNDGENRTDVSYEGVNIIKENELCVRADTKGVTAKEVHAKNGHTGFVAVTLSDSSILRIEVKDGIVTKLGIE